MVPEQAESFRDHSEGACFMDDDREAEGERQPAQVVTHQRDAGRLEGSGRSGSAPHDADGGVCGRRRVVHAVAHHDNAPRAGQLPDRVGLVLWHQPGAHRIDSLRAPDRVSQLLIVAGEHDDP